jgi:hypothetical protein
MSPGGLAMDGDQGRDQQRREKFLVVLFAGMGAFGLFAVFTFLTGGFLIYILAVVAVGAGVAWFHYLLWGRGLSQNLAGEREELEAQERAEAEDWEEDDPRRPRHF